ncbi:MAG: UrcA family protein [Gammaproteobacteria bacterium]
MTFAAFAGLASLASLASASSITEQMMAQHLTNQRTITVHFGDLDPRKPADAAELVARVKLAARNACLRNDEQRQIFLSRDREACMAQSYASAIAGINAKRNVDLEALALRDDGMRRDDERVLNAAR